MSLTSQKPDTVVILAAAGQARRFRESSPDATANKVMLELNGIPIWQVSIQTFRALPRIGRIYMTVAASELDYLQHQYRDYLVANQVTLVEGGHERWASVRNAINLLSKETEGRASDCLVAVHDAARPCVTKAAVERVIEMAARRGAAILGLPLWGTIKRVDESNRISETVSRKNLYQATTPQVFRLDWLIDAYGDENVEAEAEAGPITDDAQLVTAVGFAVVLVPDEISNIKITTAEDFQLAEFFSGKKPS